MVLGHLSIRHWLLISNTACTYIHTAYLCSMYVCTCSVHVCTCMYMCIHSIHLEKAIQRLVLHVTLTPLQPAHVLSCLTTLV